MILFGNYTIVSFILSLSKCRFYKKMDPREVFGILGESFLRGRLGDVNGMTTRSILSIVENYAIAIYLFVCFVGIHNLKDMNSLRGSVCYERYNQF